MKLGAQLYTLREHCKTLEDFAATLKRVADMGYKYVQVSGTCAYEPEWLKAELDKNGLECVLTHMPPVRLVEELDDIIAAHKILGCKHIGIGMYEMSRRRHEYDEFLEKFKPVAQKLKDNGFYLVYHNHNMEFARFEGETKTVLEMLLEEFDPSLFGITVDVYWVQFAGADPALWLEKLAGRAPCIHLKDMVMHLTGERSVSSDHRPAAVGYGNMNFDRIIESALKSGVQYALVEQDDVFDGDDPFDCLKKSYDYITSHYDF